MSASRRTVAGRPMSISASSAARVERPVYTTSSTRTRWRPARRNGTFVSRATGGAPPAAGVRAEAADVVAVERRVEHAERQANAFEALDPLLDPPREVDAARLEPDERGLRGVVERLRDLPGEAVKRPGHVGLVEQQGLGAVGRGHAGKYGGR